MITNKKARQYLYDCHNGQDCPMYRAASSGLVDDAGELINAVRDTVTLKWNEKTRANLIEYLNHTIARAPLIRASDKRLYLALPWSDEYERPAGNKPISAYSVEWTDTFSGEANYCWAERYIVNAPTIAAAITKAKKVRYFSPLPTHTLSDYGDSMRIDINGACVCCFVQWVDKTDVDETGCLANWVNTDI